MKIKKIEIEISKGKTITITPDQAKALYEELAKLYGSKYQPPVVIPSPIPTRPVDISPPPWTYPSMPIVTFSADGHLDQ